MDISDLLRPDMGYPKNKKDTSMEREYVFSISMVQPATTKYIPGISQNTGIPGTSLVNAQNKNI